MTALYMQVCDQIMHRIQTGELKIGDKLPPEADCATELGVSRSTVRLAFTELENTGVLQRRKRTGTKIIADKPQQCFKMATNSLHELLSLGRDTELTITRIGNTQSAPVPDQYKHLCETWLEVLGTRTLAGDSTPFSINRIYVPDYFASVAEPLRKGAVHSVYRCIEQLHQVSASRVTQSVTATHCAAEESAAMGLAAKAPVLRIEALLFVDSDRLMEVSVATFDPSKFQVQNDVTIA